MSFKNMKIEINQEQQLDDVMMELDRLGYKKQSWLHHQKEVIVTFSTGVYSNFNYFYNDCFPTTTLAELKEMK